MMWCFSVSKDKDYFILFKKKKIHIYIYGLLAKKSIVHMNLFENTWRKGWGQIPWKLNNIFHGAQVRVVLPVPWL